MEEQHHQAKRVVFKKNFDKLKDGFSCCIGISSNLYSRGVINADIRDTKDPDKILSAVEKNLCYSESVWETLIDVMIDPPLDSIVASLKQDLVTELEFIEKSVLSSHKCQTAPFSQPTRSASSDRTRPSTAEFRPHISPTRHFPAPLSPYHPIIPTFLPLDKSDNNVPDSPIDSGCVSTTTTGDKSDYPRDSFPIPKNSSTLSLDLKTSSALHNESNTYTDAISDSQAKRSQSNDSGKSSENSTMSESFISPCYDISDRNLSLKKPDEAATNNDTSISELVHSFEINRRGVMRKQISDQDAGLMEVQLMKLRTLENDKVKLSERLQHLKIQMNDLEFENDTLLDKSKNDQQLLECKLMQLAQDNQILSQQIEEKRRLECDNRKLKHTMKLMKEDQERLENENSTLRSRIEMAERVAAIQAVNIDRLREITVNRETEIHYLKEQIERRNELLTEMENHTCTCYDTLYNEDRD